MENIQLADPNARRKAILVVCVAALLGVCAGLIFNSLQDDLQPWLEGNLHLLLANTMIIFVFSLVVVLPILASGIYLLLLGTRSVRAQRFPPPGVAVVRDTPVLEGAAGIRRGRVIQILSLLLLCCAGAIPVVLWLIFRFLASAT
jgi:hypothetical protein